ncbi:phospholipid scramblase 1 isoform X2 [Augochlora pura]
MRVSFSYLPDSAIHDLNAPRAFILQGKFLSNSSGIMSSTYATLQPAYSPVQPITSPPLPSGLPMGQPNMPMLPQGFSPPNTICPSGLEYLMALDHLFVQQKFEFGYRPKHEYNVLNLRGEPVFNATEQSGICGRWCMGAYRSCEFQVIDNTRREVLRMIRPLRCHSCCCPCCLQELEVYSGNTLLGSVSEDWSILRPSFSVRNTAGDTVLKIKGPWLQYCINRAFKIKSVDGNHTVGVIQNEWSGAAREFFTDADNFGIAFPLDLDVKIKAVLLGACLLIDFVYFESIGR